MRKGYSVVIKTIAVVFAVAMMLSLSACKPEENDFKAAQSVVSAMFDEIISGNGVSDANKYFSSADDIPREILDSMNFRKVFNDDGGEELIEEFKGIFGAEKAEEYVETIIDKALETVSYSIDSTKAEGRNVSVSVTLTYPDEENMVFDVMGDEDEAFREIFGVSDPDDMAEAFMKKKNMSQSEFIQKYKDADLEEVTKDIFETFSDEIDAYMIKSIDNMFSNMQTTSETIEVLLAKQKDNTWKIVGYSDSMPGE